MTKKIFYIITASLSTFSCSQDIKNNQTKQKPNVVIIMADDMGIGDLECYNPNSKIPTPNMNKLAGEGMRFTNAHSPSSVSSPTRYGLLTGRYCWRTELKKGALGPFDPLLIDTARTTLADIFKLQGYATAITGKWHLGLGTADSIDYFKELKPGPLELGFDYYFGINASLNMSPHCFIENHYTVGKPDVPVPDYIFSNHGSKTMVEGWQHENVGPEITRKSTQWLQQHIENNPMQPFFLYVPTSAPHRPCTPPEFIKGHSKAGNRGDMVAEVDWTVGEIVKSLKEHKIYENTIIIVTSDNGAIGGNKPLHPEDSINVDSVFNHQGNMYWRGRKTHIWEGGHRVPMIVKWPGKTKAGVASGEMVCLTDWFATFSHFFNIEIPKNTGEDSYDILPAIEGINNKPIREALVTHSMWGKFAITKDNWKLILTKGSGGWGISPDDDYPPGQLYNLKTDSLETINLYDNNQKKVKELESLLKCYKKTGKSCNK